jgi:hypothetical protein
MAGKSIPEAPSPASDLSSRDDGAGPAGAGPLLRSRPAPAGTASGHSAATAPANVAVRREATDAAAAVLLTPSHAPLQDPAPDCASACAARGEAPPPRAACDGATRANAPAAGAARARRAAAIWRAAQAFLEAAAASPMLLSALTWVDAAGVHPAADERTGARGLRWTLAALLALHLRTEGGTGAAPSEEALLAALWTLESFDDLARSTATPTLGDYLRHLAAYDAARAAGMAAQWCDAFTALRGRVAGAQRALLAACGWRVRLGWARDLLPCYAVLFGAPSGFGAGAAAGAAGAGAPRAAEAEARAHAEAAAAAASVAAHAPGGPEAWRAHAQALCASVWAQSARVQRAERRTRLADGRGALNVQPRPPPAAKRVRSA